MLGRCSYIRETVITEVVHVLDKGSDLLACLTFPDRDTLNGSSFNGIASEGLTQNGN